MRLKIEDENKIYEVELNETGETILDGESRLMLHRNSAAVINQL